MGKEARPRPRGCTPKKPRPNETEDTPAEEKLVWIHFFLGESHWYAAEFDGKDIFFGYAILNGDMQNAEWGYFSIGELGPCQGCWPYVGRS